MIYAVHPRSRWLLLCVALGAVAFGAATGCGSDGYSPNCPDLPLYDVHKDSTKTDIVKARTKSEQENCSTPIGHATSGSGGSGPVDAGGG